MPPPVPTPAAPDTDRTRPRRQVRAADGLAQLSFIEHALSPLDYAQAMHPGNVHQADYFYLDSNRHRQQAHARVIAPHGLSAADEFYLFGLLGLSFRDPDPQPIFTATPHFVLRQLGCIDAGSKRGGADYQSFRAAIRRLSAVVYENDAFYDPLKAEHREVMFGFLSYSLPLDPGTSRAWTFGWNPIFFDFVRTLQGSMAFDLDTYRTLDPASRRLFLLLKKIFWRQPQTHGFELRHLMVNVLGFSPSVPIWDLRVKLVRCLDGLLNREVIRLPGGTASTKELIRKLGKGDYCVAFTRGPYFERSTSDRPPLQMSDSPLYDPLKAIGFDDAAIARLLKTYKPKILAEWSDITLAAMEKKRGKFFTKSPQAYFVDNVAHAAKGTRTPPDWWRELRRREREIQHAAEQAETAEATVQNDEVAFRLHLETEAKAAFEKVMDGLFTDLAGRGHDETQARDTARRLAEAHFRNRYFHGRDQH